MASDAFQFPAEQLAREGGTLAYTLAGPANGRLIVISPGIGDSRHAFRFIAADAVKAGYRVALMDLRGCGDSSVEWPSYSHTDTAGDLIALIKKLAPKEPVVLIGHSFGGGAVTMAAAQEPSLVAGLVEINPFTRAQSFGLGDLFRKGPGRLISAVVSGSPGLWLWYLDAAMPNNTLADWDEDKARIKAKMSEPGRMGVLKKQVFNHPPLEPGEKLKDLKIKTLIVMGAADCDWANPKAEAEGIVSAIPSGLGQVAMIEGAGHYPQRTHAKELWEVIVPFIRSVT